MLEPRIQRKNFNGGQITPELWYRSDLELFQKSCKELKNMVVTPWGSVTRRSPTKRVHSFNTGTYGRPLRYIPFRFSNQEYFHVVLTDNSGSARAWNPEFVGTRWETLPVSEENAAFLVVDRDGELVTLWDENWSTTQEWEKGDFNQHMIATTFSPEDVADIDTSNINDVIYMTCKGKYPLSEFFRFAYDTEANYWKFRSAISEVGPFLDPNPVTSSTVQVYDSDMVSNGNCPGISQDSLDITQFINPEVNEEDPKVNQLRHSGQFPYVLHWADGAPQGGDLVDSQVRLRCGIEDLQTDWADKGKLSNNFFRGVFNKDQSTIESYDPEFDNPSDATQNCVSPLAPVSGVVRLSTRGAWDGTLILEESADGLTWDELASVTSTEGDNNEILERRVSDWAMGVRVRMSRATKLPDLPDGQEWEDPGCKWTLEPDFIYLYFRILHRVNADSVVALSLNEGWGWPGDDSMPHHWYGVSASVQDSRKGSFSYLHQGFSKGESDFAQFRYASDDGSLKVFQTHRWSVGAWGPATGFPLTHTVHQERMCLGGNRTKPNTIWASKVNDWSNFAEGLDETSAFTFTVQSDSSDGIKWMQSANSFMAGTGNEEILISGSTDNTVFSANNILVRPQTFYGSANVHPVTAADTVFFVERNARRIRSIGYDFQSDQYLSSDIMILVSSLTQGGYDRRILRMGFVRNPFTAIFVLLDDGTGLYFVYESEQDVKGWSTVEIGGGRSELDSVRRGLDIGDSAARADIHDIGVNQGEEGDAVFMLVHRRGADAESENFDEYLLEMYEQHKPGAKPDLPFIDGYLAITEAGKDYGPFCDQPLVTSAYRSLIGRIRNEERSDANYWLRDDNINFDGWRVFLFNPESTGTEISQKNWREPVLAGYPYQSVVAPTDLVDPYDFGPYRQAPSISLYVHASCAPNVEANGFPAQTQYARGADLLREDAANVQNWSYIYDWSTERVTGETSMAMDDPGFVFCPLDGELKVSVYSPTIPTTTMRFSVENALPLTILAVGVQHPKLKQ